MGGEAGESVALEGAAGRFGGSRIKPREPGAIECVLALAHFFGDGLRRCERGEVALARPGEQRVRFCSVVGRPDLDNPTLARGGVALAVVCPGGRSRRDGRFRGRLCIRTRAGLDGFRLCRRDRRLDARLGDRLALRDRFGALRPPKLGRSLLARCGWSLDARGGGRRGRRLGRTGRLGTGATAATRSADASSPSLLSPSASDGSTGRLDAARVGTLAATTAGCARGDFSAAGRVGGSSIDASATIVAVWTVDASATWSAIRFSMMRSRAPAVRPPMTTATSDRPSRWTDVKRLKPEARV